MATEANTQSFWEHLDVLRAAIIKIVAVAVVFGIVVFFFKEQLFGVVLVPKDDGFITYQLLNRMAAWAGGAMESFSVRLINTGLARQFIIHMKTALCAGVLCASPYILYQLFRFVSPTLYDNERRIKSTERKTNFANNHESIGISKTMFIARHIIKSVKIYESHTIKLSTSPLT